MLPGDGLLSSVPVPAAFVEPRDRPYDPLVSMEYGGPALHTPATNRLIRIWTAFYEDGIIKVAPDGGANTNLITDSTVETLSIAFDANMNPTVAYMTNGVCKLWWFDTVANAMVTTIFAGVDSCQVTTDDKREARIGHEDVIFAYTRNNTLYYRQQRDRYTIEYTLFGPIKGKLLRLGMNRKNRLQFEVKAQEL